MVQMNEWQVMQIAAGICTRASVNFDSINSTTYADIFGKRTSE
jgi:hypothetical protein